MSSSKLKRDIQLLEKQLEEIDIKISDPIERIEQKKQLQREIKKLERSKSLIEQFEREQQELESLKSEFTLNSDELVDINKVEKCEHVESILKSNTSITNESMVVKSEINLSKQIEDNRNSQVRNINYEEEHPTNSTKVTSPPNNSKELGKVWIIGGTIGFFIFLGLVINGNRANQTISNTEQQASDTIPSKTIKQDNSSETEEIIQSSPEVSTQLQEQNFNSYDFPLDSCGDQDPSGANIWYRVYIDDTPENLNTIHSNYCRDAIRKYRRNEQINSIQVAAFTDESKAEAFAQLMRINIGSGEVDEPSVFNNSLTNINSQKSLINRNLAHDNLNKSYEGIDERESIILINRLYDLLSQKNFDEAKLLYDSQLTYQFSSNFFSQFERVTVENLRTTSKTQNSINFIGQNTYIWLDGSTQKELRSYQVENLGGDIKITGSQFIKVTKFR